MNESLNGWIKEELFSDFRLNELTERYYVSCAIEEYIDYYNEQRPSYALGYDTPNDFYRRFTNGEISPKNTTLKPYADLSVYLLEAFLSSLLLHLSTFVNCPFCLMIFCVHFS